MRCPSAPSSSGTCTNPSTEIRRQASPSCPGSGSTPRALIPTWPPRWSAIHKSRRWRTGRRRSSRSSRRTWPGRRTRTSSSRASRPRRSRRRSAPTSCATASRPVARYSELLDKRGTDLRQIDLLERQAAFTAQELRDLQVQFVLAWMGFTARREEPRSSERVAKERGYTEEEKIAAVDAQRRIASRIVPRWRALAERGQVEITCSPFYHPILPLIVDSDSARRAMPAASLPPRFSYPQDAREQVLRGIERARVEFGQAPHGMWPSEGSVSPEVIDLLAACGVRWCATDQGILERSELELGSALPDGYPAHYHPYLAGADHAVTVLFRDRELSDRIGFRYAKSDPREAAQDLISRIADTEPEALVTLALDGENPWEHYPGSGEGFLEALYRGLAGGAVRTVLPRDELREHPARARIARLHSGSWIDSNFRIWIGHPEDNAAWTMLGEARAVLAEAEEKGELAKEQLEAARGHLFVAEGSDWFWWYGDDFTTENAPEVDE